LAKPSPVTVVDQRVALGLQLAPYTAVMVGLLLAMAGVEALQPCLYLPNPSIALVVLSVVIPPRWAVLPQRNLL
jgi:hypothetical protein